MIVKILNESRIIVLEIKVKPIGIPSCYKDVCEWKLLLCYCIQLLEITIKYIHS